MDQCATEATVRERYHQDKLTRLAQHRRREEVNARSWAAITLRGSDDRLKECLAFMQAHDMHILSVRENFTAPDNTFHTELVQMKCRKGNWLFTLSACQTRGLGHQPRDFTTLLCGGICNSLTHDTVHHDHCDVYTKCDLLARWTSRARVAETLALLESKDLDDYFSANWSYLFELQPALAAKGFKVCTSLRPSDVREYVWPETLGFALEKEGCVFYLLSAENFENRSMLCSLDRDTCRSASVCSWRSREQTAGLLEFVHKFHVSLHARNSDSEVSFAKGLYGVYNERIWHNDRTMVVWLEALQQHLTLHFPRHGNADEGRLRVDLGGGCKYPPAYVCTHCHKASADFNIRIEFGGLPGARLLLQRETDFAICGFDFPQLDSILKVCMTWSMHGNEFSLRLVAFYFDAPPAAAVRILSKQPLSVGTYAEVQIALLAFLTDLYRVHGMHVQWAHI